MLPIGTAHVHFIDYVLIANGCAALPEIRVRLPLLRNFIKPFIVKDEGFLFTFTLYRRIGQLVAR